MIRYIYRCKNCGYETTTPHTDAGVMAAMDRKSVRFWHLPCGGNEREAELIEIIQTCPARPISPFGSSLDHDRISDQSSNKSDWAGWGNEEGRNGK